MLKVEHIGIAVKSLEKSVPLFEKLLNSTCYKTEVVENDGVTTAFFLQDGTKIELLEPIGEDSFVGKFLRKRGEGVHHIALEVEDIYAEMERLAGEGFQIINREPRTGADGKLVCFLHPQSTNGVLIELMQDTTS